MKTAFKNSGICIVIQITQNSNQLLLVTHSLLQKIFKFHQLLELSC